MWASTPRRWAPRCSSPVHWPRSRWARRCASWGRFTSWPSWCWRWCLTCPPRSFAKRFSSPAFTQENSMTSAADKLQALARCAHRIRRYAVRMGEVQGQGYIGQALGWADVLAVAYGHALHLQPQNPEWEGRDRFLLSHGHYAIAHYAALIEAGVIPQDELDTYGSDDSRLPMSGMATYTPGMEISGGSLGQGLVIGVGMALGLKQKKNPAFVYNSMSDGELDEGSTWEAAMSAAHHQLDNLICLVDINNQQADGPSSKVLGFEPLADKWAAFGWHVQRVDGNDLAAVLAAFDTARHLKEAKPRVILFNTLLTTSAMIASIAGEGQRVKAAPFGKALVELAATRPEIVGMTADLAKYTDLHLFAQAYPERFYQMGMAEQLLMGAAGGMAKEGLIPFATTYAVFGTRRAYDFIHQVIAEENLNVKMCCALPGLTTGYGPSHQATEDLAMMRGIPGLTIIDPCDALDIEQAVPQMAAHNGPVYMRLLRGNVPLVLDEYDYQFELGKAKRLVDGDEVLIISSGFLTMRALEVAKALQADRIGVGVLPCPPTKPLSGRRPG